MGQARGWRAVRRRRRCHALAVREPFFGVSAAGYRLEGGFNGPGEPANQWGPSERAGKVPLAAAPRGGGTWADPERLCDLVSSAGAEVLALSVEWARIEPEPGRVDEATLERYASIFASVAARGITPVGVLHDVANPVWLGEEFWLTPGSPDRFAEHAGHVVTRLGASCRHWVTLRQPNLVALAGWVAGRHPPRRVGALADAWAVVDNFLVAHVLGFRTIHEAQPDAVVHLGLRASASYDWHRLMVDLLCAPALGVERDGLDRWIDARRARHDQVVPPGDLGELAQRRIAAASAPFGAAGSGVCRRLRRPSPRRAVEVAYRDAADRSAGALDANGSAPPQGGAYPLDGLLVVWCPPHVQGFPMPGKRQAAPWEVRPDPEALGAWCREQERCTPGLSLWVEDGFATHGEGPRADGWDRRSYLRAQLAAASDAPIDGYLYYTAQGGGDPTWPDAQWGLDRAPGAASGENGAPDAGASDATESDAAFFRRLAGERREGRGVNVDRR